VLASLEVELMELAKLESNVMQSPMLVVTTIIWLVVRSISLFS